MSKQVIIIGAGPAGLTAAYELATRSDFKPVVLEQAGQVGGLAKTIRHGGHRLDMGGHRFFSKSDRVLDWWFNLLPLQGGVANRATIHYHNRSKQVHRGADGPDPEQDDCVMLLRQRHSSIYFARQLFPYPLRLTPSVLRKMGVRRMARIGLSYLYRVLFPVRPVENLEQFLINRFGDELYRTFFRAYTEKVWGVPCSTISAEWGAQRIKNLSIGRALLHGLRERLLGPARAGAPNVATSLVEQFLYPKYGPGQLWEEAAKRVLEHGGDISLNRRVVRLERDGHRIARVVAVDEESGGEEIHPVDFVISSMPVCDLVHALGDGVPEDVRATAEGLQYRDFITVGLLVRRLDIRDDGGESIKDSWLYIQEPDVKLGRLQIYNNWSRYMAGTSEHVWLGLEYFCNKGDALWNLPDAEMLAFAAQELARIGIIEHGAVLDGVVVRIEKAYPAYHGAYARFDVIRSYVDEIENLFLVGRNGMHKYNNQDHSMLTAMKAVERILSGVTDKSGIWEVNTEPEYLEELGEGDE